MYKIAKKLARLTPYDPIHGDYKIRLDANESFIKTTDEEIANAAKSAQLNRYPDPYAVSLIKAYSDFYEIDPELVTAGNGSDELIGIITACFLEKGERVMCFAPDFSMYAFYSSLYELDICVMNKEDDLTINVDKAIRFANENNVRAIIFSNPCNPTSLGLNKFDVKKLVASVEALVVLDEAYMDFWDESESLLAETANYDNLIVLRTCSKALAMAGLRLGFAVSNKKITEKLRAAKSPYNVNDLTQCIAEYFLKDSELMKNRIKACKLSVKNLYEDIVSIENNYIIKIYKPVTNFVFIRTDYAEQIFKYLLEQSIAVRFMGDYLRISAGLDEENLAVVDALRNFYV